MQTHPTTLPVPAADPVPWRGQVRANSTCLVVSTENVTQNWYFGNERSMLIANCLFRAGGAAVLLSNKAADYWRAKWVCLLHTCLRSGRLPSPPISLCTTLSTQQPGLTCIQDPKKRRCYCCPAADTAICPAAMMTWQEQGRLGETCVSKYHLALDCFGT